MCKKIEISNVVHDPSTYIVVEGQGGEFLSRLLDPTQFGEELVGGFGYDPYNSAGDRLFMARLELGAGPPHGDDNAENNAPY